MSTNFFVHPGSRYVPTFRELLHVSNQVLNQHLLSLGNLREVHLGLEVQDIRDHNRINFCVDDKFAWGKDHYAWIFVAGIPGGTDAHFHRLIELDKKVWKEEIATNTQAQRLEQIIISSMEIGYYWSFRRSAGQPGLVHLAYGLIAASLAQLTGGFIYSDDGAWDYSCFPALPDDFFKWYFRPEATADEDTRIWVECSIQSIYDELKQ